MVNALSPDVDNKGLVTFCRARLSMMQEFFRSLDNLVAAVLTLDELRLGAMARMLGLEHRKD